MARHGKKYLGAKALVDKEFYTVDEAIALLPKTSTTKFDASCEIHFNLKVDPKQADQNIRTTAALPHGTGKEVKVVAFVSEEKVKEAKDAGAIEAGSADLIAKIEKGWLDFDVAVAQPEMMKELGKIAKTLGQKGLMPNPKSGTVTPDPGKTIQELKKGKVEIRVDKAGNLHNAFGKVSFSTDQLTENLAAVLKAVMAAKPATLKGSYINTAALTTSMGPGIHLDLKSLLELSK